MIFTIGQFAFSVNNNYTDAKGKKVVYPCVKNTHCTVIDVVH